MSATDSIFSEPTTEDPLYQWAMQQLELLDRYDNEPTEQQDDT